MTEKRVFSSEAEEKAYWGDLKSIPIKEEKPKVAMPKVFYYFSKFIGQILFVLLSIIFVLGLFAIIGWLVIYIMGLL